MINCQERVSCQLASDLCVLCPSHLLRGKRSCLSYYSSPFTHLCHGKGDLPQRGLLLLVARRCSYSATVCHLFVPLRYCHVGGMLIVRLYAPTTVAPHKLNINLITCQRQRDLIICFNLTLEC